MYVALGLISIFISFSIFLIILIGIIVVVANKG